MRDGKPANPPRTGGRPQGLPRPIPRQTAPLANKAKEPLLPRTCDTMRSSPRQLPQQGWG
jgi:hypothetical protein